MNDQYLIYERVYLYVNLSKRMLGSKPRLFIYIMIHQVVPVAEGIQPTWIQKSVHLTIKMWAGRQSTQ